MFLTNLEIEHFRGIKKSEISFPIDSRLICLIGAGDSTKSTILKAIEWVTWPSWNLIVSDNDFYDCDTSVPIVIRGSFKEVPLNLISEDKFGMYLRKPYVLIEHGVNDEPEDGEDFCITIQLTIDSTLEPRWEVVCNRKEARQISHTDRKLLSVANIGGNCSKDMVWGKYSVLQKYADAKGLLHDAQMLALREIANHADLHALDEIGSTLVSIGQHYGVNFESSIINKMLIQNGSFSSSVGLFDGNKPLNQKGTGSQRLLSMGLNIKAATGNTLLIIDEIESGLEPYRLRSLIHEIRIAYAREGQIIMTTHSPVAVAECTIGEILVVQSHEGETKATQLKSNISTADKVMQAQLRRNADAFLCKRLIVGEGKTEIGFIRAFDNFLAESKNYRMAYKGVGVADGGGDEIFNCANTLYSCDYDVCLLMDSDLPKNEEQKAALRSKGIVVFDWDEFNALEEQIFQDVPNDVLERLINIIARERGLEYVESCLSDQSVSFEIVDGKIKFTCLDDTIKKKIGTIARHKSWLKRVDFSELVCREVFSSWENIGEKTKLKILVENLTQWVVCDD